MRQVVFCVQVRSWFRRLIHHCYSNPMSLRTSMLCCTLVCGTVSMHAVTSKQNPGAYRGSPPCNVDLGEKVTVVAGPRSCFCYEIPTGHVEFAPNFPGWIIGSIYNMNVNVSCSPETLSSSQQTCTYREDCWADYNYSVPGWMYYWSGSDKPIFTVEAGPGNWP